MKEHRRKKQQRPFVVYRSGRVDIELLDRIGSAVGKDRHTAGALVEAGGAVRAVIVVTVRPGVHCEEVVHQTHGDASMARLTVAAREHGRWRAVIVSKVDHVLLQRLIPPHPNVLGVGAYQHRLAAVPVASEVQRVR